MSDKMILVLAVSLVVLAALGLGLAHYIDSSTPIRERSDYVKPAVAYELDETKRQNELKRKAKSRSVNK